MNISDCMDELPIGSGKTFNNTLNASNLDEEQLIKSIANLLYETKSVKEATFQIEQTTKLYKESILLNTHE